MGRPSSVDRLVRLLALPAWVAEHPGASFDEAAAHFGVGARTIEKDVYTPVSYTHLTLPTTPYV